MNDHLYTNAHGLRLIQEFEGAPRLKARLCEGNRWELSFGCTFYPDGSPVCEGDTCTEEEAHAMFRHALQHFEQAVRDMVMVPLNSNQFSALVAFAYNVGIENAKSSTVIRECNAGRFYDAAAAFGMWVFATDARGYKRALRGLLRREYATACLFLSYDWTEACADDAIALQVEKPANLPGKDKVIYKTAFKDVLGVAQEYPLSLPAIKQASTEPASTIVAPALPGPAKPADELVLDKPLAPVLPEAKAGQPGSATQPAPAAPAQVKEPAISSREEVVVSKNPPSVDGSGPKPASPPPVAPSPPAAKPQAGSVATKPVPPVSTKPPEPVSLPPSVPVSNNTDYGPGLRNMFRSKRFWGGVLIIGGRFAIILDATGSVSPFIRSLIGDSILMDWTTGLLVNMIGEGLMSRGEKKAEAPLGTPREVALYTKPPVRG